MLSPSSSRPMSSPCSFGKSCHILQGSLQMLWRNPGSRKKGGRNILAHGQEEAGILIVSVAGGTAAAVDEVMLAQARAGHQPALIGLGPAVAAEAGDGVESIPSVGLIERDGTEAAAMAGTAITSSACRLDEGRA